MGESDLIKHLHAEKISAQEQRAKYTLQKLIYATALLGIGSLDIPYTNLAEGSQGPFGQIKLGFILYLVPVVAVAFDLHILAEDYSVKRIGAFLAKTSSEALERVWEDWVTANRDLYAPFARPFLTIVLTLGSALAAWAGDAVIGPFVPMTKVLVSIPYWVWWLFWVAVSVVVECFYLRRRKRVRHDPALLRLDIVQPSEPIQSLRSEVRRAKHVLNWQSYEQARRLFACTSDPRVLEDIPQLAPEYGRAEYLLCVKRNGEPAFPSKPVLEDYQETIGRHPDFGQWFQQAEVAGKPVLLIARWMCHLVGFRHRAVHLFIDHPTADDYTLVQVRGLDKAEAPGRFDLPAAGHVVGLDSPTDALFQELEEELGLTADDISSFTHIGNRPYGGEMDGPGFQNVEFRMVYSCRLNPGALDRARFVDREVAALSVYSRSEIETLIGRFPERVASGLKGSFPVYRKARETKQAQTIPSAEEGETS